MMTAGYVSAKQMKLGGFFGLVSDIMWLISAVLFATDFDSTKDITTEEDIVQFHVIVSSKTHKIEFKIAALLCYISIPFFMYKVSVTKRYLNDYFGELASWFSSIYSWLSLMQIMIWSVFIPS
eukprot:187901_1